MAPFPSAQSNRRPLGLGAVNPYLKLALGIGLMVLAFVFDRATTLGVLVAGLLVLLDPLRLPKLLVGYVLLVLGVFVMALVWLLGSWSDALLSALRLLAITLPVPVLSLSTPAMDLIRALQRLPLPSFLSLSVLLIWRFFPLMMQEVKRIWEANVLRGIDLRRQPGQWFSGLLLPLIFQLVAYADEATIGLQTRGYAPDAPRSCSRPLGWRWLDTAFSLEVAGWVGLMGYVEWIARP